MSQICQYYDVSSDLVLTNNGVQQDSVLGPLLFFIYINDLVNTTDKFNFLMYADDIFVYCECHYDGLASNPHSAFF